MIHIDKVYKWLEKHFEYEKSFKEILKEEKATLFLLVWPILEQMVAGGYMKKNNIACIAETFQEDYEKMGIDEIVKYFHERYQDSEKRRNLLHLEAVPGFNKILELDYKTLTNQQKLELIIAVIYRYRNIDRFMI